MERIFVARAPSPESKEDDERLQLPRQPLEDAHACCGRANNVCMLASCAYLTIHSPGSANQFTQDSRTASQQALHGLSVSLSTLFSLNALNLGAALTPAAPPAVARSAHTHTLTLCAPQHTPTPLPNTHAPLRSGLHAPTPRPTSQASCLLSVSEPHRLNTFSSTAGKSPDTSPLPYREVITQCL